MKDLCNILKITVNELLSGELINKEDYNKKIEEYMLEIYRQKEECEKYNIKFVDTSYNREKVLNELLEYVTEKIRI